MKYILGLSCYYHDSAAVLIKNGIIIAGAQEERFTRIKHDADFPKNAVKYVLDFAGINLDEVEYVAYYEKPLLKFERILENYISVAPLGFKSFRKAMPIWVREKLFLKDLLLNELKFFSKTFNIERIMFSEHHFSHAASAFFPSPFKEAIVLTLDGVGEWATTTVAIGNDNNLEILKELHYPHSLGLLYSAFTYFTGFKVNSGEYKVMGLAPYGNPVYKDLIFDKLIDLKEDGSFRLNQEYFNYTAGLEMTNDKFSKLFGRPVRKAESEELEQFHMDIAASIQSVTEEVVLKITRSLSREFKINNLCLAGGVALNCVANGRILEDTSFENIWAQPAAGDAGGAIGAALALWHCELNNDRSPDDFDGMSGSYLGPSFNESEIKRELASAGAIFRKLNAKEIITKTALNLSSGKAVGWFQGRMEFGPRALGGRSIIADPRSNKTQKNLNLKVKYRESFRPFAPSILSEDASEWFEIKSDSPYMLFVAKIKKHLRFNMTPEEENLFGIEKLNIKRSSIPAVTHLDYSARVQTVDNRTNPRYHALLKEFKKLTNCPILVNTSFNVRGEPIVCTPTDAFKCFMGTDLDILVIENFYLVKKEQNPNLAYDDYKLSFEKD